MERLAHGYTNCTRRVGRGIEKRYEGADSLDRAGRESDCLTGLRGRLPVPEVLEFDPSTPMLIVSDLRGRHGQELIDEGRCAQVLRLLGSQLSLLQSFDPSNVPGVVGTGDVIVHRDFGPQNTLFLPDPLRVSGVLDWELAHIGSAVEDVAGAEWIIRTHHSDAMDDLPELFVESGWFSWSDRQAAMVRQCCDHLAYCEASGFDTAAREWRQRLDATERWNE
jgi:tRNA A-37 threonylcarbamoyl transferase component Bud32